MLATSEAQPARATRAVTDVGVDVVLVLAVVAAVTIGQGGYYRRVSTAGALLLAVAAVVFVVRERLTTLYLARWTVAGLAAMVGCTLVTGVVDGHAAAAQGSIALLVALAVIVTVVAAAPVDSRRQVRDAVLALGAFVAATGWVGVAFRVEPLGHPDGGLWRAATTLTYANAAAAILGPLALWALARSITHDGWQARATAVLLLVGLGATMSRAGFVAFALGLLVLSALIGFGVVWRAVGTVLLGGGVATAALASGMPVAHGSRPLLAVAGLAVGVAIGVFRPRLAWTVVLAVIAVGAVAAGLTVHTGVWSGRLSASSPDRTSLTSVAMRTWREHRLTGVGPGRAAFTWSTPDHWLLYDRYAHDEYLQVAVEQGAVGLVGLAALIAGIGATAFGGWMSGSSVRRRRRSFPLSDLDALRAGAIAGLVCLALHSGFDFLWHVPAVPMVAAVAIGLTARLDNEVHSQPSHKESS